MLVERIGVKHYHRERKDISVVWKTCQLSIWNNIALLTFFAEETGLTPFILFRESFNHTIDLLRLFRKRDLHKQFPQSDVQSVMSEVKCCHKHLQCFHVESIATVSQFSFNENLTRNKVAHLDASTLAISHLPTVLRALSNHSLGDSPPSGTAACLIALGLTARLPKLGLGLTPGLNIPEDPSSQP